MSQRAKRRALVTGGAGGIGRACAWRLGSAGDALVLADLALVPLEEVRRELAEAGIEAEARVCDVSDVASVAALGDALARKEPLAAVVHTAGLSPTMAGWREIVDVDLVGTARILEAVLPRMAPDGAAVCIASMASYHVPENPAVAELMAEPLAPDLLDRLEALPGEPVSNPGMAYAYAKRAVRALVARLAPAWGARGARLVSLSPGMITTPMGRQEFDKQPAMAALLERTPLGRLGDPEEIASVVSFLCSHHASFLTGCDLLVDGGVTAATGLLE